MKLGARSRPALAERALLLSSRGVGIPGNDHQIAGVPVRAWSEKKFVNVVVRSPIEDGADVIGADVSDRVPSRAGGDVARRGEQIAGLPICSRG